MPRQTRKKNVDVAGDIGRNHTAAASSGISLSPVISDQFLAFLNALPTTGETLEWIKSFRESLQQLLGDVDKVVVKVNINCDLLEPRTFSHWLEISQVTSVGARRDETVVSTRVPDEEKHVEQLVEEFRQLGYPMDEYQRPHSFNYYYAGKEYLGTILLLRDRTKTPVSALTLQTMTVLEPFLTFLLSDVITRHFYARPVDRIFPDVLTKLEREAGLSVQDVRILVLMLLGYSYKQVADRMDLSLDTIRKHTKRIYRKTRTGSLPELFAKYFTPRLGIEGLGEDDSL